MVWIWRQGSDVLTRNELITLGAVSGLRMQGLGWQKLQRTGAAAEFPSSPTRGREGKPLGFGSACVVKPALLSLS